MDEKLHPYGIRRKAHAEIPAGPIKEVCLSCNGEIDYYPNKGLVCHKPPCPPGKEGVRMLRDYMEKEIGGVLYRVHSIFANEGDFQEISEELLMKRVLKAAEQGQGKKGEEK